MKARMFLLLLAAVLTVAAWEPASSSAEDCPVHPCSYYVAQCQNAGGTVLSLTSHQTCTLNGRDYTVRNLLCQVPPATFWDEVCYQ